MIMNSTRDICKVVADFVNYNCVVIICKYNGGKSSIAAEIIHEYFGEEKTCYVTFIDQSKQGFTPRKSKLKLGEIVRDKVIVFDEIANDSEGDIESYIKELIKHNLVVILTNPYGSSNDADREIELFKKHEKGILPEKVLFVFVKA